MGGMATIRCSSSSHGRRDGGGPRMIDDPGTYDTVPRQPTRVTNGVRSGRSRPMVAARLGWSRFGRACARLDRAQCRPPCGRSRGLGRCQRRGQGGRQHRRWFERQRLAAWSSGTRLVKIHMLTRSRARGPTAAAARGAMVARIRCTFFLCGRIKERSDDMRLTR